MQVETRDAAADAVQLRGNAGPIDAKIKREQFPAAPELVSAVAAASEHLGLKLAP